MNESCNQIINLDNRQISHFVTGYAISPPYPSNEVEEAIFALGCFWGAERFFWQQKGVLSTAVGYSGGFTELPTYKTLCSGITGHAEVVKVIFNPSEISYQDLLELFWQAHNPTQGMRQGNDVGEQYRSVIFTLSQQQQALALQSKTTYQKNISLAGFGDITTEIVPSSMFYYAETMHQQYLAKDPSGYCGLRGLGVLFSSPA